MDEYLKEYSFVEYLKDKKIINDILTVRAETLEKQWKHHGKEYIKYCLENELDYEDINWQITGIRTEIN